MRCQCSCFLKASSAVTNSFVQAQKSEGLQPLELVAEQTDAASAAQGLSPECSDHLHLKQLKRVV